MKKLLTVPALLLCAFTFLASCNKGDDNPYGDWRCTCFVTKIKYVYTATDTITTPILDTVYLQANDVDKNTAKSFCEQARMGYTDTVGGTAACTVR
jgi:hypothetical protein